MRTLAGLIRIVSGILLQRETAEAFRLIRPEITHYMVRTTKELAEILGIAL